MKRIQLLRKNVRFYSRNNENWTLWFLEVSLFHRPKRIFTSSSSHDSVEQNTAKIEIILDIHQTL